MSFLSEMFAWVRPTTPASYAPEDVSRLHITRRGELVVAQGLPSMAELARLGRTYQVRCTTGQAALTSLPSTTAGFTLRNPVGSGIVVLVHEFGSSEHVVDATQTDVTAIFAMMNQTSDTAPSGGSAETGLRSMSGRANASIGAIATYARGQTVADNAWFPHDVGGQMAAAAAGANWKVNIAKVDGIYQVPPGGALSICAVKAAAAAAAQQFYIFRVTEVPTTSWDILT